MAVARMQASSRNAYEFDHQCALFKWARLPSEQKKYPGLDLLSSSLNGVRLSASQAYKASKSGMLSGELDIRLPVAQGGYHSLSIELKHGKGRPTANQLWYHRRMMEEGNYAAFLWSWWDAKSLIIRYLTGRLVRGE